MPDRWTTPLAVEISRLVLAFDAGDSRRDEIRRLADWASMQEGALMTYADPDNWVFNEADPLMDGAPWIWLRDHNEERPGDLARAALARKETTDA